MVCFDYPDVYGRTSLPALNLEVEVTKKQLKTSRNHYPAQQACDCWPGDTFLSDRCASVDSTFCPFQSANSLSWLPNPQGAFESPNPPNGPSADFSPLLMKVAWSQPKKQACLYDPTQLTSEQVDELLTHQKTNYRTQMENHLPYYCAEVSQDCPNGRDRCWLWESDSDSRKAQQCRNWAQQRPSEIRRAVEHYCQRYPQDSLCRNNDNTTNPNIPAPVPVTSPPVVTVATDNSWLWWLVGLVVLILVIVFLFWSFSGSQAVPVNPCPPINPCPPCPNTCLQVPSPIPMTCCEYVTQDCYEWVPVKLTEDC